MDKLHTEFLYYGSLLKTLAPSLSNDNDKDLATRWIRKLFGPEYHTSKLREKRNRFLSCLVASILHDEMVGVFKSAPPDGALPDLEKIEPELVPAANWEVDKMWQEILQELPENFTPLKCSVHEPDSKECQTDHKLDKILDQEFQLFLYIARPYAALLRPREKIKLTAWIQTLATVHDKMCSSTRAVRNDYMMAVLGCLNDLRADGPFLRLPPTDKLLPIHEVMANQFPITDPTGPDVEKFLSIQPMPEDGAFCYIALTGDLISSTLGPSV